MVCNAIGCREEDDCSILMNGFRVTSLKDGTDVYTAEKSDASLSITGGDDTSLSCDSLCECQMITSTLGCNVPISPDDRSEQLTLVDDSGEEYTNFNQLQEESRASAVSLGGGLLVALAVSVVDKLVWL